LKFLHAADLHIDSPLRGLDAYPGAPVERIRRATRVALTALVELALAEGVDLVLLAGDIYDGDWPDFKTGLFFREQMARLTSRGIRVFVARGNHDAESVITRNLPSLDGLHVFSARRAETVTLDELAVAVHGRSYAEKAVMNDLTPDYPAALPALFNIGVLHTSLAGHAEHLPYAPTSEAALVAKGYDYWALGHIHQREVVREQQPRIVFPGNLQGRHAKETGSKGCELVEVQDGRIVSAEHIALDTVRWHRLVVNADGIDDVDGLAAAFNRAAQQAAGQAHDRLHAMRVVLDGESALAQHEAEAPDTLAAAIRAGAQDFDGPSLWIEKVVNQLRSPFDRAAALQRNDALGEVLRLIDELASDDGALQAWALAQVSDMKHLPPGLHDAAPAALTADDWRAALADAERSLVARLASNVGKPGPAR
jgi:DNA repair exonuclease SbcCD nuclease subunit